MSKLTKLIDKVVTSLEHEIATFTNKKGNDLRKKKELVTIINKLVSILQQLNKLDKDLPMNDSHFLEKEDQEIIDNYINKYYKTNSE